MEIGQTYSFDRFKLDVRNRQLLRDGVPVSISAKAFDLLLTLIQSDGQLVAKEDIFNAVWRDQIVEESNLTVHVSQIRKILGESKNLIETVPGYGYRFVGELLDQVEDEVVIETRTVSRMTIEQDLSLGDEIPKLAEVRTPKLKWMVSIGGLALIMTATVMWYWNLSGTPAAVAKPQEVRSIAVLPFQFLNGTTRNDGLELGLTESLINRLSSLQNVSIRPIGAVKKYSMEGRDLLAIAKELNVDSILEGNIQQDANRLRLTVRLVNAKDGTTFWNEQIDEDFADIFAVQDKISNRVAGSLKIALSESEKQQLAKVYTEDIEAYRKYLAGRHHWNKRSTEGLRESIALFNQAIDADPAFALAFAGLADSYLLIGLYSIEPTTDAFPKARAAAEKALAIDQDLAEAYASLAMVENLFAYDWKKAEEHFTRAVELRPSYSTGHHWFGLFLAMQGRTDEALIRLSKAIELDPLSLSISTDLAFAYYLADQADRSIDQLNKTLKQDPNFANAHNMLGMNYVAEKRFDAAFTAFETASRLSGGRQGGSELIWANGFADAPAKARELMQALNARKPKREVAPFDMALISTSLGEKEQAIEYLYQAYETRDPQIVPIKVFPPFASLRNEPRFRELLRKMNL